ncbi:MAG: Ubiquitin conjugation factor E4 B, partial [Marteilia pararefringens]
EELNNQATRALGLSDNFLGAFNRQFEGILNDYERRKAVCKYSELIQTNSVILSASFQYYELASKFISNLIEEHEEFTEKSTAESYWSFLPESFIENIEISLLSISKLRHENLYVGDISELFHLSYKIICAYCSIDLIRNKHLIAKIIYALLHIMSSRDKSFLSFLLSQCENYEFIRSMIYIFNEFTSDSDSDKFTLRLSINDYFKNLKLLPSYSYLNNLSAVADKYYMKYINTILDDLSYTLNEGLNTLKKIREHQLTHSGLGSQNPSNNLLNTSPASTDHNQGDISSNLTEEERVQNHVRNERSINSLLLLSVSNLETLKDLTLHSQEEFLKDEILMRLVPMLNYNIGILCGDNSMQFKVKNSQKYNWNPRKLLGLIIDVFLNMRHKIFYQSLAADNTTSLKAYKKAYNVMIKNLKKTVEECNQFKIFIFSLDKHITESKETNEMLEDAPEEFLDPLTYVLMKDPVKLPSGVIMERTVIIQHLLTQNTDPFTRQELKESELVEDIDLKNKIEMWLKSKMRGL